MKKYLLILGCVCLAFAALADNNVVAGVNPSNAPGKTCNLDASNSTKRYVDTPDHKGGRPHGQVNPSKPRIFDDLTNIIKSGLHDSGDVACMSEESSVSFSAVHTAWGALKQHILDNGLVPMGGKRRDPVDPSRPTSGSGFASLVMSTARGNVSVGSAKETSVSINDVTTLIDQLLEGKQASKSIDDVTMLIDQLLTNTAE